jgi:DNA-directed RNA polymerase subunit RPC12/RpoP
VSVRRCFGCGGEYRKGSRVVVLCEDGSSKPTTVCPKCSGRALVIVPLVRPKVVQKIEKSSDDVDRALRLLTSYTKPYKISPPEPGSFLAGRLEGLETAIEVLKKIGGGT